MAFEGAGVRDEAFAARLQAAHAGCDPARVVRMQPGGKAQQQRQFGGHSGGGGQRVQGQARVGIAPDHADLLLKRGERAVIVLDGGERVEARGLCEALMGEAAGALAEDQCQDGKCGGKSRQRGENQRGIGFRGRAGCGQPASRFAGAAANVSEAIVRLAAKAGRKTSRTAFIAFSCLRAIEIRSFDESILSLPLIIVIEGQLCSKHSPCPWRMSRIQLLKMSGMCGVI